MQPCRTLGHAYAVARPGATIVVGAGSYPQQHILEDAKPSGPPVVIRPAAHAVVRILGVQLGDPGSGNGPHGLVLRELTLPGREVEVFEGATDVTLQGVQAADFYIRGAQRVRVVGGSYGPCLTDGHNPDCGNSKVDTVDPPWVTDDVVIDHVVFHDYRIVRGSGAHFECLFIRGGSHVSVLGSRFVNCEFFDLFVQWSGTPIAALRIERNRFEPSFDGSGRHWDIAMMFSGGGYVWKDVRVLGNAFVRSEPIMDDGTNGGFSNVVVAQNLLDSRISCFDGVMYRLNISAVTSCGSSDRTGVYGYRLVAGRLVVSAAEAATVRQMFAAAAGGRPLTAIANLSWSGSVPPSGGWTVGAVRAILTDRIYLGSVVGPAGADPPLVTRSVWRAAQRALAVS